MSDRPHDEIDTGEPVAELGLLAEPPDENLIGKVRRRIDRRLVGAEFVRYSWAIPFMVALEYVKVVLSLLSPDKGTKEHEG